MVVGVFAVRMVEPFFALAWIGGLAAVWRTFLAGLYLGATLSFSHDWVIAGSNLPVIDVLNLIAEGTLIALSDANRYHLDDTWIVFNLPWMHPLTTGVTAAGLVWIAVRATRVLAFAGWHEPEYASAPLERYVPRPVRIAICSLVPADSRRDPLDVYAPCVPYEVGEWAEEKTKALERCLNIMERDVPGTLSAVIGVDAASPQDLARYSAVHEGHWRRCTPDRHAQRLERPNDRPALSSGAQHEHCPSVQG